MTYCYQGTFYIQCSTFGFVTGETSAVNPKQKGTKVAAHYVVTVPPGEQTTLRVRFYDQQEASKETFGKTSFDDVFQQRINEADEFYAGVS